MGTAAVCFVDFNQLRLGAHTKLNAVIARLHHLAESIEICRTSHRHTVRVEHGGCNTCQIPDCVLYALDIFEFDNVGHIADLIIIQHCYLQATSVSHINRVNMLCNAIAIFIAKLPLARTQGQKTKLDHQL